MLKAPQDFFIEICHCSFSVLHDGIPCYLVHEQQLFATLNGILWDAFFESTIYGIIFLIAHIQTNSLCGALCSGHIVQ